MNENGNEKCSSLLFLLVLVFGAFFRLPFVAFCCSSLLVLVFDIESVLSQKPKQANAFGCSFVFLLYYITLHYITLHYIILYYHILYYYILYYNFQGWKTVVFRIKT